MRSSAARRCRSSNAALTISVRPWRPSSSASRRSWPARSCPIRACQVSEAPVVVVMCIRNAVQPPLSSADSSQCAKPVSDTAPVAEPLSGWWVASRPRYRLTSEVDRICLSGCVKTWMQMHPHAWHKAPVRAAGLHRRAPSRKRRDVGVASPGLWRLTSLWPAAQAPFRSLAVRKRCCVESRCGEPSSSLNLLGGP